MNKKKTIGECLRNNWNSINTANKKESRLRVSIQNKFSINGEFDLEYYTKNLWNEEVEDND